MESKLIPITKLKNNSWQIDGLPKNPRILKDDKYKKLLASIKEDPEMLELREVIAYDNGDELIVIAWNMRLKACKEVWLKEVPTKILPKETTIQKLKRYTIKDNVSFWEWDNSDLANEWDKEELEEWWLDVQFETVEPEAEEDDFEVDEGIKTDIVLWDLFEIGEHRLLCWDSTNIDDVNKLMNGEKADMVFTDPPYWVSVVWKSGNIWWSTKYWSAWKYREVIWDDIDFEPWFLLSYFQDSKIILWWANYFSSKLPDSWKWLVWDKNRWVWTTFSDCELAWTNFDWISVKKYKCTWDWMRREWESGTRVHPTQKPIKLCSDIIKDFIEQNKIIVDIYWWSGSTMVACHQLNRRCYMSELDPKYVQTIINRMIKLDSTLEIKRNWIIYNQELWTK